MRTRYKWLRSANAAAVPCRVVMVGSPKSLQKISGRTFSVEFFGGFGSWASSSFSFFSFGLDRKKGGRGKSLITESPLNQGSKS